jgi:hypothetical protein
MCSCDDVDSVIFLALADPTLTGEEDTDTRLQAFLASLHVFQDELWVGEGKKDRRNSSRDYSPCACCKVEASTTDKIREFALG